MKIRSTLAAVLLLSAFSHRAFASDCSWQCDLDSFDCSADATQRVVINNPDVNSDITAFLAAYLLNKIPDNWRWSGEMKSRGLKTIIKSLVDTHVTRGCLEVAISNYPHDKPFIVMPNDSGLEIGYVIFKDIFNKAEASTVLLDGCKTFISEQFVRGLLFLINQTNIEQLLPTNINRSTLYQILRAELARYGVGKGIDAVISSK